MSLKFVATFEKHDLSQKSLPNPGVKLSVIVGDNFYLLQDLVIMRFHEMAKSMTTIMITLPPSLLRVKMSRAARELLRDRFDKRSFTTRLDNK